MLDVDKRVRMTVYEHIVTTSEAPPASVVANRSSLTLDDVLASYTRLRASRLLFLEPDGATIRMAPPFSGVPTQHRVRVRDQSYYANCAWDALGIVAATGQAGTVFSRCEQSLEPLTLEVGKDGPEPSPWLFHFLVPAAEWWDDLVFT